MNMSDATTGQILWQDDDWGDLLTERDIHIPRAILKCRAVSREFQFSSVEMLQGLRLEQRIFFRGGLMEEWNFHFGFVIPNSTNTWQQTIEAAEESKMLPAAALEYAADCLDRPPQFAMRRLASPPNRPPEPAEPAASFRR
jgi:retinal rod rhodopsin-sensitive cGMP 3',5'-cyclic phosphodiesterase subunit delta